jgi:hypothetical protein
VGSVLHTPPAILLELDALPVVVPVLLGYVITPLALGALEGHVHAPIAGHSSPLSVVLLGGASIGSPYRPEPSGLSPWASTMTRRPNPPGRAGPGSRFCQSRRVRPQAGASRLSRSLHGRSGPQSIRGGGAKSVMGSLGAESPRRAVGRDSGEAGRAGRAGRVGGWEGLGAGPRTVRVDVTPAGACAATSSASPNARSTSSRSSPREACGGSSLRRWPRRQYPPTSWTSVAHRGQKRCVMGTPPRTSSVRAACGLSPRLVGIGSGGWTRTTDSAIMSRLLCL